MKIGTLETCLFVLDGEDSGTPGLELLVGGFPFPEFIHLSLAHQGLLDTFGWGEEGPLLLRPDMVPGEADVTLYTCECGQPGCGSTWAAAQRVWIRGTEGVLLTRMWNRNADEPAWPVPQVFIPLTEWDEQLSRAEKDAVAEQVAAELHAPFRLDFDTRAARRALDSWTPPHLH